MRQWTVAWQSVRRTLQGGNTWASTVVIVVLVGIPIVGPIVVRRIRKIRGRVQTGTAQVLSLKQFGSVAVNGLRRGKYAGSD